MYVNLRFDIVEYSTFIIIMLFGILQVVLEEESSGHLRELIKMPSVDVDEPEGTGFDQVLFTFFPLAWS